MYRNLSMFVLAMMGIGFMAAPHQAAAQEAVAAPRAEARQLEGDFAEIRPRTIGYCDPHGYFVTRQGIALSCNILTGHISEYFNQVPGQPDPYYYALVTFRTEDFGPTINSVTMALQMLERQRAAKKDNRLLLGVSHRPGDAGAYAACDLADPQARTGGFKCLTGESVWVEYGIYK